MPSDPNIILGIKPPPVSDPMQTIGALMALKGQQGEQALRNAQLQRSNAETADITAKADQLRRDQADENTIQQKFKDPAFAKSVSQWDGTSAFPLDGVIQPRKAEELKKSVVDQQKQQLTLTKDQRAENDAMHEEIGQTLQGLSFDEKGQKRTDTDIAALAPGAFAQLVADKQLKPENVPTVRGWDDVNAFAVKNRFVQGLNTYATKAQEGVQKIATDAAAAVKDTGQGHEAQSIADKNAALTPLEAAAKTTENAQKKLTLAGTSPTGITADEAEKNRVAQGHLAVAQADLKIKRDTFNTTVANAANLGISSVPVTERPAATSAYTKAGEEYATAAQASDAMKTMLDMAQKGNKAAGSNLPLVGVETLNAINGIKRINSAEIAQYGSAGSLLDKVKGKIGALTVGQPVPKDVIDDIRALHEQLDAGAKTKYANKVQVINGAYGSQFKPVEFGAATSGDDWKTKAANARAGEVIDLPNGHQVRKQADGTFLPISQ
jgi:hypothetical protein